MLISELMVRWTIEEYLLLSLILPIPPSPSSYVSFYNRNMDTVIRLLLTGCSTFPPENGAVAATAAATAEAAAESEAAANGSFLPKDDDVPRPPSSRIGKQQLWQVEG